MGSTCSTYLVRSRRRSRRVHEVTCGNRKVTQSNQHHKDQVRHKLMSFRLPLFCVDSEESILAKRNRVRQVHEEYHAILMRACKSNTSITPKTD